MKIILNLFWVLIMTAAGSLAYLHPNTLTITFAIMSVMLPTIFRSIVRAQIVDASDEALRVIPEKVKHASLDELFYMRGSLLHIIAKGEQIRIPAEVIGKQKQALEIVVGEIKRREALDNLS